MLRLDGQIDASNADVVAEAIRRFSKLMAPLIIDTSRLEFLGLAGLRALLTLNNEHQRARLHCSVVGGAALHRLTRVVTGHGLPVVDSVPEALQIVEDVVRARRGAPSGPAQQQEPQTVAPAAWAVGLPS
ncbi:MAG: STAS domain-containing protein [Mycobacterium sp.]|nr:STAS domain-containing protein [Mycobacterium sp.]